MVQNETREEEEIQIQRFEECVDGYLNLRELSKVARMPRCVSLIMDEEIRIFELMTRMLNEKCSPEDFVPVARLLYAIERIMNRKEDKEE
jgi:hypothetical protein